MDAAEIKRKTPGFAGRGDLPSPRTADLRGWLDGVFKGRNGDGVYVVKTKQRFGRLVRKSDIILIGKSSASGGVRGRVRKLLQSTVSAKKKSAHVARDRLLVLRNRPSLSLSLMWYKTDFPEALEGKLLRQYHREHLELPPLNRNLPSGRKKST